MRALLGLLALLAVSVTTHGTGYEVGKEYWYEYNAFLHTIVPEVKSQSAGLVLKSKVIVQPKGDYFMFKMSNVLFDKINEEAVDFNNHMFTYRIVPELNEHLTKPFKVMMKNGKIVRFQVSRNEPVYSLNMKKGLLTLFKLDLEAENQVHDLSENYLTRSMRSYEHVQEPNHYKVMEDGIAGECETMYEVYSYPRPDSRFHNVLNVTKVKNFKNCNDVPYKLYGNVYRKRCVECESMKTHPVINTAEYHYNLRGSRRDYVIEHVDTEAEVIYVPFTPEGEIMTIVLNRTLELVHEMPTAADIHMSGGDSVQHSSLVYSYQAPGEQNRLVDLKKAHDFYTTYGFKADIQEIGRLMRHLADFYYGDTDYDKVRNEDLAETFMELVRAFSTLDYEEIDGVYHQYVKDTQDAQGAETLIKLFIDTLLGAGTNPAFSFGKYLIVSHQMPSKYVSSYVRGLALHVRTPTEILMDEFYRMCDSSYVKLNENIYRTYTSCMMSLSALVHKTCVSQHKMKFVKESPQKCTPTVATKFFNYIIPQYERDLDDKMLIMYLKIASNFGIKESVEYIEKFIVNSGDYAKHVRISAVFDLGKMAQSYPEKVRAIVHHIYMNISEPSEIRIAAFITLMKTTPDLYILEMIAEDLLREPSHQVVSFVYSAFKSLAKSTHPCDAENAQHIKYVLPILEKEDKFKYFKTDLTSSFMYLSSGYEKKYDYGGQTQFSMIMSNDSYLPMNLYLRINDFIGGNSYDGVTLIYQGYGVEKILNKHFGPKITGNVPKERSLFNYFGRRRAPRDTSPQSSAEKELREINEKLPIDTKDYDPVFMKLSVKIFYQDLKLLTLDERDFALLLDDHPPEENMFRDFMTGVQDIKYKNYDMGANIALVMPTELGLPIFMERREASLVYYKNNDLKLAVDAHDTEGSLESVKVNIKGHFMTDTHAMLNLGVLVPFEKSAVGFGKESRTMLSLPMDAEATLYLKDSKLNLKIKPIVPNDMLYVAEKPYTFIESYDDYKPLSKEDSFKPFYKKEELLKVQKDYFHSFLGVGISAKFKRLDSSKVTKNLMDMFNNWDFRQKFYFGLLNPQFLPRKSLISLTPDTKDVTNEIEMEFSYNYYSPEVRGNEIYTSNHFNTDDLEGDEVFQSNERKLYTHVLKAEVTARGERERKMNAELAYTYTKDILNHKIKFFYDRTPFYTGESDHSKICLYAAMKFPDHDMNVMTTPEVMSLDNTVNTNINLHFGRDCKTDKKIIMTGKFEHTDEQKYLIEHQEEVEKFQGGINPYNYLYKMCKRYQATGVPFSKYCFKYVIRATELNKLSLDIDYENIPVDMQKTINNYHRYIKHQYYPHLYVKDMLVSNPEGKIKVMLNASAVDRIMDVMVKTPKENAFYYHIPVPKSVHSPKTLKFMSFTNLASYTHLYRHRLCDVQGPSVSTFDRRILPLPDTNCYKVLAKDCSPEENFMILGAKIDTADYTKALKIFVKNHKIEVLPVSGDSGLIVRIDGNKVDVSREQPYVMHVNTGVHNMELFRISFDGKYFNVLSDIMGMSVNYDGTGIFVQVAPYYRGKMCGLCGDYNSDPINDLAGPDKCMHIDEHVFGKSYVIPSDDCDAPQVPKSPCSAARGKSSCTLMRNRVTQHGVGKNRQVCFSTVPLPQCSDGCVETTKITREIGFHCLPAKDKSTRDLQLDARIRPLYEFKRKSEDHRATIEYPENCYTPEA